MKNKEKAGIGIIGCGQRIKDLFSDYPELFGISKIIGVYDINPAASQSYLDLYGKDIKIYKDYKELLKNKEIKWVFIGSINSVHSEHIIESLNHNKHVFCEKPLSIKIEDCGNIRRSLKGKNLNFFIGYVLRYAPLYRKIKEIVDKGEIGKIISLEFNETIPFNHGAFIMSGWRRYTESSGGFLIEKCCHDIDIVNWIVGDIPDKVVSFGGLNFFIEKNSHIYDDITKKEDVVFNEIKIKENPFSLDKDIVDNQTAIIEYRNKVRASFHTNCSSAIPERRIYVCGEKGTIRADLLNGKIELGFINNRNDVQIFHMKDKEEHGGGDRHFMKEIEDAMLNKNFLKNYIDEAVISSAVCIALDDSMYSRKIVEMEPIWKYLEIIK